jgi:hypothetical protein
VIAIALDESPDAVRPLTTGIDIPVLYDRDHLLTELLAITNVPTVVWVDEDDHIVRPNATEFGTDTFAEFTGVQSEGHKDLVRRWVRDGEVPLAPEEARTLVGDLDPAEVDARLHFRLAVHLRREGDDAGAARHFDAAVALAPLDFTISRAALPLRGGDPFGPEFFALYERWKDAGSPYRGLSQPFRG